jgi:hypothetical protein
MKSEITFRTWQPLKTLDFPYAGNWGNVFHFRLRFFFATLLIDSYLISPRLQKLLMITEICNWLLMLRTSESEKDPQHTPFKHFSCYERDVTLTPHIFDMWHYQYNRRPFMIVCAINVMALCHSSFYVLNADGSSKLCHLKDKGET